MRTFVLAALLAAPIGASAQGEYRNTERGHPLRVEDATPIERFGLDLQLTPLRFERFARGLQAWSLEPSLAYGLAAGTQIEIGLPLHLDDRRATASLAGAGVEVSLLHALTIEGTQWPAIALSAAAWLPAGGAGPSRSVGSVGARVTRTFAGPVRLHLNYDVTLGTPAVRDQQSLARWMAGVGLDHTLPLRSILLGADLTAAKPFEQGDVEYTVGAGLRVQLAPRWAMDVGIGRRVSGASPGSFVSLGGAYSFSLRALGSSRPASPRLPHEQVYLPAAHNWMFRTNYPGAERLFNAFDYGHAILYETLWREPTTAGTVLEEREYAFLTDTLLNAPPGLAVAEHAVAPLYGKLAPEAMAMFDWAHLLHRQVYDILADERLTEPERDAAVAEVQQWYLSRRDLAFSTKPKSMALMEGQPYSLAFRRTYPKFNGLIWSYHWLQMGLYEPLLTGLSATEKQAGVAATVARFREMLLDAPRGFPAVMPMTPTVAPAFTERYPTLAVIFDNLHSMHDVISDILANPSVPRDRKRAEIIKAGAAYRDDVTEITSMEAWLDMARMMGGAAQGGPVPRPRKSAAGDAAQSSPAAGAMNADAHAMHHPAPIGDSAFAEVQKRGAAVMGVDQYSSQHAFTDLPDGGRIVLVRDAADTAGTRAIREHLRALAAAFARGEFLMPGEVHATEVPGTRAMGALRDRIAYAFAELPGGGSVVMRTSDPAALAAIGAFLAFQRTEHRAPSELPRKPH